MLIPRVVVRVSFSVVATARASVKNTGIVNLAAEQINKIIPPSTPRLHARGWVNT
jgi:hypothetical protein